jgi:hypothetical protein
MRADLIATHASTAQENGIDSADSRMVSFATVQELKKTRARRASPSIAFRRRVRR